MSIFGKLFQRTVRTHCEKAERLMAAERYAEARVLFEEALELFDREPSDASITREALCARVAATGLFLARLNLSEADGLVAEGNYEKAEDHVALAVSFSEAPEVHQKAEELRKQFLAAGDQITVSKGPACTSCAHKSGEMTEESQSDDSSLSLDDRFELLVNTLPGDLPQRYRDLGEHFAVAYLAAHDGEISVAATIVDGLLQQHSQHDILLHERALLHHREGSAKLCEEMLRMAIRVNPENPLCYLALVDLLIEEERYQEAIPLLNTMQERGILVNQAGLILADIQAVVGETELAMRGFRALLATPMAKEAAKRMIPILESAGNYQEAEFIAKRFNGGCC